MEIIYLLFIVLLAAFLGFELIRKVPATLHTPLMSGSNFIHGVVLVGAIIALGMAETNLEENKNKTPSKMARLAWPKAKYGVIIAIIIIIFASIIPAKRPKEIP